MPNNIFTRKFTTVEAAKITGVDQKIIDMWVRRNHIRSRYKVLGTQRKSHYFSLYSLFEIFASKIMIKNFNINIKETLSLLFAHFSPEALQSDNPPPIVILGKTDQKTGEIIPMDIFTLGGIFEIDIDKKTINDKLGKQIAQSYTSLVLNTAKIKNELFSRIEEFDKTNKY